MTPAATTDVPAAVRQQAQAMADAEQVPHYIVREATSASWLITPELPWPTMPAGTVFPGRRARSPWASLGL